MYKKFISFNLIKPITIALFVSLFINHTDIALSKPLCVKGFDKLKEPERHSLQDKQTKFGVKLNFILKSGFENPKSKIGCYAGDSESYAMYEPVLSYVIKKYHKYNPYSIAKDKEKKVKFNEISKEEENLLAARVLSTRIRFARNLSSYPFPSSMTKEQRIAVERLVLEALKKLPKEYQGKYYPIDRLSKEEYAKLLNSHLIFRSEDGYLQGAGIFNDWPAGRGAYISNNKKFIVWINEEDHIRVMYLEKGVDFLNVYSKVKTAVDFLEKELKFAYDRNLGYLNSCPTNIGTAMRASVHIKLNNLYPRKIRAVSKQYGLSIRGTNGELSKVQNKVYDISNSRRLGVSSGELIANLIDGVVSLSKEDQKFSDKYKQNSKKL